jgi:hypothetical protein
MRRGTTSGSFRLPMVSGHDYRHTMQGYAGHPEDADPAATPAVAGSTGLSLTGWGLRHLATLPFQRRGESGDANLNPSSHFHFALDSAASAGTPAAAAAAAGSPRPELPACLRGPCVLPTSHTNPPLRVIPASSNLLARRRFRVAFAVPPPAPQDARRRARTDVESALAPAAAAPQGVVSEVSVPTETLWYLLRSASAWEAAAAAGQGGVQGMAAAAAWDNLEPRGMPKAPVAGLRL